jgi:hypothetical protein
VLNQPADTYPRQRSSVAAGDADAAADRGPASDGCHVVAEYPQFPVSRTGDASEQVDERCRLRGMIAQDAEGRLAGDRLSDAEARRAHSPAPPAPHADASS